MAIGSWILQENLRPFLEICAQYAGYHFDDWDWDAFSLGIKGTDEETGKWFGYVMEGDHLVKLSLAWDADGGIISVQADSDAETELRLDTAVDILASYTVVNSDTSLAKR